MCMLLLSWIKVQRCRVSVVILNIWGFCAVMFSRYFTFMGFTEIPAKHIMKRWWRKDVLPEHLTHLQRDQISVNSIIFRHSDLYKHAMEVVRLGDANTSAYEKAKKMC